MRRLILTVAVLFATALPAQAQVRVDIGIHLPGPPALAVIPGAPVYYAPSAQANVFFYGHQYWVFHGDAWHVGPSWSGPWVVVAPVHVPLPILHVPVRYYKVRPGHWKQWRHDAHPRWEAHYGRDWREDDRERHWHESEKRWDRGKPRDDDRHPGRGKGRGHGKKGD
ncbi:MAG TPA: hypothetical protein VFV05_18790 [Methylomirabilota bacterium]|nr:hypothetical protein [Methylomirabilota bacterium]